MNSADSIDFGTSECHTVLCEHAMLPNLKVLMTRTGGENRSENIRPCVESTFRSRLRRGTKLNMALLKLVLYLHSPGITAILHSHVGYFSTPLRQVLNS
jgi:hypothetical protein